MRYSLTWLDLANSSSTSVELEASTSSRDVRSHRASWVLKLDNREVDIICFLELHYPINDRWAPKCRYIYTLSRIIHTFLKLSC